jgi:hypothetical protein
LYYELNFPRRIVLKVEAPAVKVIEVPGEGLIGLLGQRVTLFCEVYIYTGKLVGVNDNCVKLEDPAIVFETGDFKVPEWRDAQKLSNNIWYVQISKIESYGIMK